MAVPLPGRPPVVMQSPVVTYQVVPRHRPSLTSQGIDAPAAPNGVVDAELPRLPSSTAASPQWQHLAAPHVSALAPSQLAAAGRGPATAVAAAAGQRRPMPPGIAAGQPQTWVGKSPILMPASGGVPGTTVYQLSSGPHVRARYPSVLEQDADAALPEAEDAGSSGGLSREISAGRGAPSAVLAAAVQLAAAASSREPPQLGPSPFAVANSSSLFAADIVGVPPRSPLLRADMAPPSPSLGPVLGPVGGMPPSPGLRPVPGASAIRPRWASMTEEEMRRQAIHGSPRLQPSPMVRPAVPATPSPHLAPSSAWPVPTTFLLPSAGHSDAGPYTGQARRRWASVSDDEQASPMIFPQRSPMQRSRRSTSQPLMGGAVGLQVAAVASTVQQPFMLPQAHHTAAAGPLSMQTLVEQQGGCWGPPYLSTMGMGPAPGAWPMQSRQAWGPSGIVVQQWAMQGGPMLQAAMGGWAPGCDITGTTGMSLAGNTAGMVPAGERAIRAFNGMSVIWVGERAFRAQTAVKEQIETLGFVVKIYRSHDKCSRALDKKHFVSPANTFVASEADAEPLLDYLLSRRARSIHFIVDAEQSTNPIEAKRLEKHSIPQDSTIAVRFEWDEVLAALRGVSTYVAPFSAQLEAEISAAAAAAPSITAVSAACGPRGGCGATSGASVYTSMVPEDGDDGLTSPDSPWTLVWVSDQAFKPAAGALKTRLEALGCQVKGYKTHKNAARALDKKRVLVRTIILVSGAEAAPFIAYLQSRPEISGTPVVVEAFARAAPVRESATCKVTDSFEAAIQMVRQTAADPKFG